MKKLVFLSFIAALGSIYITNCDAAAIAPKATSGVTFIESGNLKGPWGKLVFGQDFQMQGIVPKASSKSTVFQPKPNKSKRKKPQKKNDEKWDLWETLNVKSVKNIFSKYKDFIVDLVSSSDDEDGKNRKRTKRPSSRPQKLQTQSASSSSMSSYAKPALYSRTESNTDGSGFNILPDFWSFFYDEAHHSF